MDMVILYIFIFFKGNWEDIIRAIRLSDEFMFNYYLKSRDKTEIQKRVDYLVKVLEKEVYFLIKYQFCINEISKGENTNISINQSNPNEDIEKKRKYLDDILNQEFEKKKAKNK